MVRFNLRLCEVFKNCFYFLLQYLESWKLKLGMVTNNNYHNLRLNSQPCLWCNSQFNFTNTAVQNIFLQGRLWLATASNGKYASPAVLLLFDCGLIFPRLAGDQAWGKNKCNKCIIEAMLFFISTIHPCSQLCCLQQICFT